MRQDLIGVPLFSLLVMTVADDIIILKYFNKHDVLCTVLVPAATV